MPVAAYGIVAGYVGSAQVMEQSDDPAAVIGKLRRQSPHFLVNIQRMVCQTADVAVMMVAAGREIVALLQIGNHIAHPFAADIA